MTKAEIKQAYNAGNSPWEILSMVVNDGVEYPDAVWLVSQALRMKRDEVEQMERDYDEII